MAQEKVEVKYTDSTINRPYGERIIDSNYVFSDLPAYIQQIKNEKDWKQGDRNAITVFKFHPLTITLIAMKKDAKIEDNEVNGFINVDILEGEANIILPDGTIELKQSQLLTIHPHVHHSIIAKEECIILLTSVHQTEEELKD